MKTLLMILFLGLFVSTKGQKTNNALHVGVVHSAYGSASFTYDQPLIGGGDNMDITKHAYAGISVLKQIRRKMFLETGVEVEKNTLKLSSGSTMPNITTTTTSYQKLNYVTIPLLLHLYATRNFFLQQDFMSKLITQKTMIILHRD